MEHCCDRFGYKAFLNPLAARSNMVVSFADQALSFFTAHIIRKVAKKVKIHNKVNLKLSNNQKP